MAPQSNNGKFSYQFADESYCQEPVYSDARCILHVALPDDKSSDEFKNINALKEERVKQKAADNDWNFEGAYLSTIDLTESAVSGNLNARNVVIEGDASFDKATIGGTAYFTEATIKRDAVFGGAKIKGVTSFSFATVGELAFFIQATLEGDAVFDKVAIGESAWFSEATIAKNITLHGAKIKGDAIFELAKIDGDASFYGTVIDGDALFQRAEIGGGSGFHLAGIKGTLNFREAQFSKPKSQAEACAKATQLNQKAGYTREVDYHYYRQMVGERQLKPWYRRYSELSVQYVIGYGVYPFRLVWWFLIFVVLFGLLFSLEAGVWTVSALVNNLRDSFLTIFNPISGIQNAGSGIHGTIAMVAAFIGIVMWPVFVASLARKYGK
ncbi:MAG: pentapeptide repeat-containing protein [Halobacteriota archaeon]